MARTDCPCTFSQPWCGLVDFIRAQAPTPIAKRDAEVQFKVFGTTGLRDHAGTPRQPIYDRWTAARAQPIGP